MISQEDIQKVREATDLVALVSERTQVKQKGRDFWACCPIHQEKTPSFKIDPSTQLWHCFGCDEGGDAFGFVMKTDDLSFPEAVRKLAERAHIEIEEGSFDGQPRTKRQRLKEVCAEAAAFFHMQLMRGRDNRCQEARDYLSGRGLGGSVPKEWQLGFAPGNGSLISHLLSKGFTTDEMVEANVAAVGRDGRIRDRFYNRVMFPIDDVQGDPIAFGGRILEGDGPKYLNSQETPIFHKSNVLYGLDKAKASMTSTGMAIVTEGYTDVISMHKAGLTNTVAALGTALTKNHVRTLARHAGKKIVYIFDGDAAGQRATERALQFIDDTVTPESGKSRIGIFALCLPDGMDPAEFLQAHGADEMRRLVDDAEPLVLFGIKRRIARHDRGSAEGRTAALADALDVLAPIKDSILAKDYARQIAGMLQIPEADVMEQLARLKPPRRYDAEPREDGAAVGVSQQAPRQTLRISVAERNRLLTERELLGQATQNPMEALQFADTLKNVKWHDRTHLELASSILDTLMNNLGASPAQIVEEATKVTRHAPSILTAANSHEDVDSASLLRFLAEELEIGDLEEELARLRSGAGASGDDEFQRTVALQDRLNVMKNSHKPVD